MITYKQIASIGGAKADAELCTDIAEFINAYGKAYFLDTPARIHHFLGQCHVESGGFALIEENLNYSVAGLKKTFGRHRISEADCNRYGAVKGSRAADKKAIANRIYGGAFGRKQLGNTAPTDGWDFRGSSIKQITGRANFAEFTKWIRNTVPSAPDFVASPDMLRTKKWAVWPAVWYWVSRQCYLFADKNDVLGLTKKINGGTNGLADRKTATAKAARIIGGALPSGTAAPQPSAERVSAPAGTNVPTKPADPQRDGASANDAAIKITVGFSKENGIIKPMLESIKPVPVYGPESDAPPARTEDQKKATVRKSPMAIIYGFIAVVVGMIMQAIFSVICAIPFVSSLFDKCSQ